MNQSRFKALKIVMQRAQINNCPIAPVKTTLYKDIVSGKKVFVNEFKNNGEKKVLSFSVRISCFDENVKLIGTIKDYKYNDVNASFGEEFGQGKIIACPDQSINSLAIVVTHVELEDDYYWDEAIGKVISHADSIEEEVEIEMAPALDDMNDIASEVERNVASMSEPEEAPIVEPVLIPQVSVAEPIVEPVAEPVAEPIVEPLTETIVTPITLDTPIEINKENVEETPIIPEVLENVVAESVVSEPVVAEPVESTNVASADVVDPIKQAAAELEAARRGDAKKEEEKKEEPKQPIEVELNFDNAKSKKSKKPIPKAVKIIVALVLIAAFLFVAVVAFLKYRDYSNYNRAAAFMANGNYEYAINTYTKLGNYADSPVLLAEAKKAYANSLKEAGDFAGAIEEYNKIGGQEEKIAECYDAWVLSLVETGKYQDALDMIAKEDVTYSKETVNLVRYNMGVKLYESKYYEEAVVFFADIRDYEDSDNLMNDSYYQLGLAKVQAGDYDKAIDAFGLVANYKDSATQIKNVKYLMGKRAKDNHKFDEAIAYFEEVAGYEDADELVIECYYQHGLESMTAFDYETAMECFKKIEGNESYEDLEDKYNEALYKCLLEEMKEGVTLETMDKLGELPKNYEDSSSIIKTLNKYVDHVGEYEWMTSNDKDINSKGGFEEHVIVTLAYNEGEVIFTVDDHPVDLKLFVYKSGTDSDTYTMLNTSTITRTFNGKIHTYKKIKE